MIKMESDKQTALQVFDAAIALLPSTMAKEVMANRSDPKPLKKGNTNIMRLRMLPQQKAPILFWNSAWCFYEIGVGTYSPRDGEGLNCGGIQFFQNPNMKVCGTGIYRRQVTEIISALAKARPGFVAGLDPAGKIHFGRRYLVKDFRDFPVTVAGEDLAWLIEQTLPRFQAIAIGSQCHSHNM